MMELRPIVVDENGIILGGNMRFRALQELYGKTGEIPDTWVKRADELTEDQKKEFIIKDNVSFGDWDFDALKGWDEPLDDWGLSIPQTKETTKLSEVVVNNVYYEPQKRPSLKLSQCVDTSLFDAKIKALDEYDLTAEQKKVLKLFAYRFLKIDFEAVANYYAYCATDNEKKAIERLRLVLCDNGLQGFIDDHLLKVQRDLFDIANIDKESEDND